MSLGEREDDIAGMGGVGTSGNWVSYAHINGIPVLISPVVSCSLSIARTNVPYG